MAKFLVVEDDPVVSQTLIDWLESEHHTVELVEDGAEAADMLRLYSFDIVILDWQLPGKSGVEICRNYRAQSGVTPILMLTGQGSIDHREAGLDAGADDYLTKPFHIRELAARVRALLRRPFGFVEALKANDEVFLDPKDYSVSVFGEKTILQPREFSVLECLVRHPGQFYSTEQLLNQVWTSDSDATPQALRACIKRIRQRTNRHNMIESARNCGYRFSLEGAKQLGALVRQNEDD